MLLTSFVLAATSILVALQPSARAQDMEAPDDLVAFRACMEEFLEEHSGMSPTDGSAPICDMTSDFVFEPSDCAYTFLRYSFSRHYSTFPRDVFFPRAPVPANNNTINGAFEFTPATREEMDAATQAIQWFMQCQSPFTVRCGAHSNAGASVSLGKRLLDIRGLTIVEWTDRKEESLTDEEWTGSENIGTVAVGAGNTAGRAVYLTYEGSVNGALPVGQRPSVGMSGLTLGGGFGFLTRFSGLLCDRLTAIKAIIPDSEMQLITATADNEYSDLFWASCGGGGGNFAVITEFEFAPVAVCQSTEIECTALKIDLPIPASLEVLEFYQTWSMNMSTRITPNLEVHNSTHVAVTGVFLGTQDMWAEAVEKSGATLDTPISSTDLLNSFVEEEFAQILTDLTGWTYDEDPDVLVLPFFEERTYFKYKSLWLFEPLPDEALDILIEEAMLFPDENNPDTFLVFEYQSLGGDPGFDHENPDEYPVFSPKNLFSAVAPKDTAFPHRGAKHCLMFKSQSRDAVVGNDMLRQMEMTYAKIRDLTKGQASYYNHNDASMELETPYFKNGVELNPGVSEDDKNYWLDRLAEVRKKYNPNGMLVNDLGVGLSSTGNACPSDGGDETTSGCGGVFFSHAFIASIGLVLARILG